MTKVIINGISGKMGTVICNVAKDFKDIDIVAGIDKFPKENSNIKIFSSPSEVNIDYDVLLVK